MILDLKSAYKEFIGAKDCQKETKLHMASYCKNIQKRKNS